MKHSLTRSTLLGWPTRLPVLRFPFERARRCDSGTAAIEFALMTPFLLALLGGVVEIGFATYESMQVNAAVEAGVLQAARNASTLATNWSSAAIRQRRHRRQYVAGGLHPDGDAGADSVLRLPER